MAIWLPGWGLGRLGRFRGAGSLLGGKLMNVTPSYLIASNPLTRIVLPSC
jgi:hypothetical protein